MIPNARFWQNRSVVVTGGTGFLGSHIVRCLQDQERGSGYSLTMAVAPIPASSLSLAMFETCLPFGKHSRRRSRFSCSRKCGSIRSIAAFSCQRPCGRHAECVGLRPINVPNRPHVEPRGRGSDG